jgi:hypothetical protein
MVETCETSIIDSENSAHGHGAWLTTRSGPGPGSALRAQGHGTGTQTFPILGSKHLSLCAGARRRPSAVGHRTGRRERLPSPLCTWAARAADRQLPHTHETLPIRIHIHIHTHIHFHVNINIPITPNSLGTFSQPCSPHPPSGIADTRAWAHPRHSGRAERIHDNRTNLPTKSWTGTSRPRDTAATS